MSWSRVKKGRKPLGWWYHKIMAEFWYAMSDTKIGYFKLHNYYKHIDVMCKKYRLNLYGEKI